MLVPVTPHWPHSFGNLDLAKIAEEFEACNYLCGRLCSDTDLNKRAGAQGGCGF